MTTYTPDLKLRLAVAKTIIHERDVTPADEKLHLEDIPEFDISLDAIMPLVRELSEVERTKMWVKLREFYNPYGSETGRTMSEWILFEATPADYCRAYLAAKGEKDVL